MYGDHKLRTRQISDLSGCKERLAVCDKNCLGIAWNMSSKGTQKGVTFLSLQRCCSRRSLNPGKRNLAPRGGVGFCGCLLTLILSYDQLLFAFPWGNFGMYSLAWYAWLTPGPALCSQVSLQHLAPKPLLISSLSTWPILKGWSTFLWKNDFIKVRLRLVLQDCSLFQLITVLWQLSWHFEFSTLVDKSRMSSNQRNQIPNAILAGLEVLWLQCGSFFQ